MHAIFLYDEHVLFSGKACQIHVKKLGSTLITPRQEFVYVI